MRDAVGAEKLARGEVAPATQAAEDSRVAQAFERPLRVAVDSGVSGVGPARGSHIICLPMRELDLAAEGSAKKNVSESEQILLSTLLVAPAVQRSARGRDDPRTCRVRNARRLRSSCQAHGLAADPLSTSGAQCSR